MAWPGWTLEAKAGETVRMNFPNNGDTVRVFVE